MALNLNFVGFCVFNYYVNITLGEKTKVKQLIVSH